MPKAQPTTPRPTQHAAAATEPTAGPGTTTRPALNSATAPGAGPGAEPAGPDRLEQAATALTLPWTVARQLLPDNPVPVALGAGALAVAGIIEWPVAAAIGLGYAALRRWRAPRPAGGGPTLGA
jgi:hypothetical protein